MAQVLLGGFSWKFRAITSLTDELNSSHHAVFHREGRQRVVGCCAGWLFFVVGFWLFFFRFPQVSVFILQDKEVDCKDLPIPLMSQCVLGSYFG